MLAQHPPESGHHPTTHAAAEASLPTSPFVTRQFAADYLGVTLRTVDNMAARGALQAYRVADGPLIRFRRDDVEALLQPVG